MPDLNGDRISKGVLPTLRDDIWIGAMRQLCARGATGCLRTNGTSVDAESKRKLERAIGAAYQRSSLLLKNQSEGYDLGVDPSLFDSAPDFRSGNKAEKESAIASEKMRKGIRSSRTHFSILQLLNEWWDEAKAAKRKPSIFGSYRNTAKMLIAFLKHDRVIDVTPDDIITFKNFRLKTPSPKTGRVPSAKTVKDSDLSALETLFGWAVDNRKVESNPALGIRIKIAKPKRLRSKGFTDLEAEAILNRALKYTNKNESHKTAAAKRWVPWLCAFTGARVGEIAQLRGQDVFKAGERWVIRITPEAGTVKTNEARQVVLHQQAVELGFPAFATANGAGHLFLQPDRNGGVLGSGLDQHQNATMAARARAEA